MKFKTSSPTWILHIVPDKEFEAYNAYSRRKLTREEMAPILLPAVNYCVASILDVNIG
jgi:hypothetical protein